jgi:putative hemolysin
MDNVLPLPEANGIVICLLLSAFFSGSETVLTALPETRARHLMESEPGRYGILKFWLETKRRILVCLLVGNNAVNILCSVLAYQVALYFLPDFAEAISVFGLTLVVLIFSEVTPKSLALHYSERVVVTVLRFVWVVDKLLWPVSTPLARIPALILQKSASLADDPPVTEDEIEFQIRLGHTQAVFEEKEQGDLLMSALEFSDTNVKEVMVPRIDIVGFDVNTPVADVLDAVINSGHSRIPVFRENLDNIIGLLHAKDLLRHLKSHSILDGERGIEKIVRGTPIFAPETQKISTLLAKMRRRGQHMAIVVDEFGGTSGLITLEDIIEELVGEIRDEFDYDEAPVRKLDANTWIVDARVSLHDFKDKTGIELPISGDYESVGGFLVTKHGNIPPTGMVMEWEGLRIKVLASDQRRVERIEIKLPETGEP